VRPPATQTRDLRAEASRGCPTVVQGDKHKRVALSLHIARLASSAGLEALQPGALVPAAVKAVEDHGYSLTFGIKVGCAGLLERMKSCSAQQVKDDGSSLSFGIKVGCARSLSRSSHWGSARHSRTCVHSPRCLRRAIVA
jgi:hypothetical protein